MAATGQTINDRLNAVRYALAGQGLARTVCKATTEEVLGPKKKHIDYLLACTDEPNVSIPQLANLLIDRSQHTSWTVVFKSLITIHHLLNYGNERFTQYLATSNHSFELNDFMDRTTPQGYGMSTYVRRYAKYINNKISSYRTLAIDLCKVKPGKDNGLRTMNMDNLCKTLPVVHNQFDSLLDFGVEAKDLNNGIIMAAFRLLYKDLNRIFIAYQEAIINLVERYFKLSRKKTREALNMYKKYLDRMDKVANFFKIVEQVGIDKNEMPDTSKLTSLLAVLEDHMAQLEAKKRGGNLATPDIDDDGDEQATPSKSQESTSKSDGSKQPATVEGESKKKEEAQPTTQVAASPASGESSKKAPPPPARPSPVKLPKAAAGSQSGGPGPSSQETEKKAPPERPAKPPSRPPPPSAASQATAAPTQVPSSSVTEATRELETVNRSPDRQDQVAAQAGPAAESSPTSPTQKASQETSSIPDQAVTASQANGSDAQPDHGEVLDGNGANGAHDQDSNAAGDDNATTLPTCSSTLNETVEHEEVLNPANEEAHEDQSNEVNHVSTNNVNNHDNNHAVADEDLDPPPPPPPIDE